MWEYHSIMLWMLHVLIMLFSSRGKARKAAAGIWMWMEKDGSENFFVAPRNVIYFFGKMKMSVKERDIRRFVSLLGYDSLLLPFSFRFGVFPFATRWRKGLKRFHDNSPRLSRMMIYFRINVTIKRDFSPLAQGDVGKSLKCHRSDVLSCKKFHAIAVSVWLFAKVCTAQDFWANEKFPTP